MRERARPGRSAPARHRLAASAGVLGSLWVLAHAAGLLGPLDQLTFVVLGAGAVVATVAGVRRYRPALRWPWWVICAALVLFLVGGAARVALRTLGDLSPSRSLVPDLIILPGYALLGAGLTGLARARRQGRSGDLDAVLDGAVAALAALALAWVFLINPVLSRAHAPLPVRLLLAAYPPMSVFLVAITARLLFSPSHRQVAAYHFVRLAMVLTLVGDIVYMFVDAGLAHVPTAVVDVPYGLAYVLSTMVVLHPSMRELSEPVPLEDVAPTRPRLALVSIALGIPALVTVSRQEGLPGDGLALAVIALALTGTAAWRVFRALHAHARSEARMAYQATHDALTRLPNRLLAHEHLTAVLAGAGVIGGRVAVLFIDIDRFKLVNDTFGHSLGDELLVAAAQRLCDNVAPGTFVARIGGDEFLVVLEGVSSHVEALRVADSLRCCLRLPFEIRGAEIYTSASFGVAMAEVGRAVDAETLIRDADTAMYEAKAGGRDGVAVFDASMRDRVAERLALERDLRHALDRGELYLHYQPIVELPGALPRTVEALLRWSHPTRGLVSPEKFVPIAEDSGIIVEIGAWVIREGCRAVARWRREVPAAAGLSLAVNLSGRQLQDPRLVAVVHAALSEHDLPPEALSLELTESMLMDDPTAAAACLSALRSLGVTLVLDDFGTGYSSLAHLRRFPVDGVKIDRSFVECLDGDDTAEESVVAAVVAMAAALGMTTTAEGVETLAQERRATLLGCGLAQGYLYSRPVPPEQVPDVLSRLTATAQPAGLTRR